MNTKTLLAVLVVVVALAGIAYFFAIPEEEALATAPDAAEFSWKFEDAGYNEELSAETTKVTLTYDTQSYDVGTYLGSCAELGKPDMQALFPGEISAVLCWFAGGGDEVGVFFENGKLLVKRGVQSEPQGDEVPAFRGDFTTILEL